MKREIEEIDGWPMKRKKINADGSEATYHCALRRREHGCHASYAVNLQTGGIRIIKQHSRHDRDPDFIEVEMAKAEIAVTSAARPQDRPKVIIADVCRRMSANAIDLLGSYDSVRKRIERARECDTDVRNANLSTAIIQGRFTQTKDNSRFLLYDGPMQKSNRRALIFASDTCLDIMRYSRLVIADGTFDSSPDPFMQLVTFHCEVVRGIVKPVAFLLLESKDTDAYVDALNILKTHPALRNWSPRYVILDFELAIRSAFSTVFPGAEIYGCYFHLVQSWRRRAELTRIYSDFLPGNILYDTWHLIKALPFCDPIQVRIMFGLIVSNLPGPLSLMHFDYFRYLEENYIGTSLRTPRFSILSWNCIHRTTADIPRTTNSAESFHKNLSEVVSKTRGLRKVRMSDLLEILEQEEESTRIDAALIKTNPNAQITARRKSCFIEKNAHLKETINNRPTPPRAPLYGMPYLTAVAVCLKKYF